MHILLLTDMPPCSNYTAGLVEKQLCEFLFEEGHQVGCVSIMDPSLTPRVPDSIREKFSIFLSFDKPNEGYGRRKFGDINSFIFNNYNRKIFLPILANKISDKIRNSHYNFDLIWSVIQGQTMICLVPEVANKLNLDYVVEIWDPPEWWLDENQFDSYSYNIVMQSFKKLLENSKCCLAASHNMAKEYNEKYGVSCVPVIPSLDDVDISTKKNNCDEFHIGYSGQIYSKKEFSIFVEALESLNWFCEGKKIILNVFTDYIDPVIMNKYPNILRNGWIPQDELLKKLAAMDLCYCPYRFDKDFAVIARLSFPSKLTTYLKTGVPVLVHAPDYSSISNFVQDGISGYVCNTTEKNIIANKIKLIIKDRNRHAIGIQGHKLFLNFLTNKTMKQSFFKSLGMREINYENCANK